MDFFAAQDRARATSRTLVWWFALCVAAVVAVIYLVAVMLLPLFGDVSNEPTYVQWWDPQLALAIGPLISGVIVVGSIYKLSELSAGGFVVARNLGGRPVSRSTTEPLERRLINVVDEMAIAAGLPSPEIWLLEDEPGINAFAAGTDPGNAVIGVTSGCLERLDRDELQGVIAHEFSHILNGDMKLNQRLMGWIFGLVMISVLGRGLLRLLEHVRPSRNSKETGGVLLVVVVAGVVLWVVGVIGVFFARLLQAAVSRQREFLADASAVQFTRNPAGIADALKKIGGSGGGGDIHAAAAAEARHFFFTGSGGLSLGFRTHPPLDLRIRAIEPQWDGKMIRTKLPGGKPEIRHRAPQRRQLVVQPTFIVDPGDSGHVDSAVGATIHSSLIEGGIRMETKEDARCLVLGMLMGHGQGSSAIADSGGGLLDRVRVWAERLSHCTASERLALLDLSLPYLRRMMTPGEGAEFISLTERMIAADGRVSLFEFMLQKVIARQVGVALGLRALPRVKYFGLANVVPEVATVVRTFAGISGDPASLAEAEEEFRMHTGQPLPGGSTSEFDPVAMTVALEKIEALPQLAKIQILRLCGLVVRHDGLLDDREMELLRATAEAVGAPIPPFVRLLNQVGAD